MASISVQDQVKTLLSRSVAEARVRGAMSQQFEAQALFETLATNLVLKPKTALLIGLLARNGLLKVVDDEIEAIDTLIQTISDLANTSYTIRDLTSLKNARTALQQLEGLDRVATSGPAYQRFDREVDKFLRDHVSKSVKVRGATELKRPSNEAQVALPEDLTALKTLHEELLDRLYALAVGVDNFQAAPFSTLIGLGSTVRAGADLDDLIDSLESSPETTSSADVATRLITNRAAISTLSATPNPFADVVGPSTPEGYSLSIRSANARVEVDSSAGPFTLDSAEELTVSDGTTTLGPYSFPQTTVDLDNQACILGDELTFPLTVPASYYLFLTLDGVPYSFGPITNGSRSKVQVLNDLNTAFSGAGTDLVAEEFCISGTNRLLIRSPTLSTIEVVPVYSDGVSHYTNSLHDLLGLETGQLGEAGTTDTDMIVDAFNELFSTIATAVNSVGIVHIESVEEAPGAELTITATTMGISGTHKAASDTFELYGSVYGEETDPVDPRDILDIGDLVTIPTGTSRVTSMDSESFTVGEGPQTYEGSDFSIVSALDSPWQALDTNLEVFLREWKDSKYKTNLNSIDLAISPLRSVSTPAQRSSATALLNDLRDYLEDLKDHLEGSTTTLPDKCASREYEVLNGILESLEERRFDRAIDLLMRCKILEILGLTHETASYGGNLLKSLSDVAQNDVAFPNRSLDEEMEGVVTDSGGAR